MFQENKSSKKELNTPNPTNLTDEVASIVNQGMNNIIPDKTKNNLSKAQNIIGAAQTASNTFMNQPLKNNVAASVNKPL